MRSSRVGRALLLFIALTGCQKNDISLVPPDSPTPAVPVTGQLVLPDGSALTNKKLTVINGRFRAEVENNEYIIDTSSLHGSFTFVTDDENRPYLMKYYERNGTDLEISPHSTALALLMSTPLVSSLTEDGKQAFIQFITATSEFATLESEIKNNLISGISLVDSTNGNLRRALTAVFEKATSGSSGGDSTSSLQIQRVGRTVTIASNGAANTYIAGVYKDGERVSDFTIIDGTSRYATSTVQALNGIYTPYTSFDTKTILLDGNGKFEVKIRSGNPILQDGSQENYIASKINLIDVAWSMAENLLPGNASCLKDAKDAIRNNYDVEMPAFNGTLYEMAIGVYGVVEKIIADNIDAAAGCYEDHDIFNEYAATLKMYVHLLGSVSAESSGAMNVTPQLYHMYYNQQQIDLCYTVDGSNVTDCNAPSLDTFTYVGYFALPGTTIGAAIKFRLSFQDEQVSGYATSIAFDYGSGEQTVPVTGTLDGNNMRLQMHIDNGITPALVDCVPDAGCSSCRYTGDHVIQDWDIVGTVNENHSTYSAEYTRKYVFTSLNVSADCTTSTVVEEAEENGLLAY